MDLPNRNMLRRVAYGLTFASAVAPLCSIAASHLLLAASFLSLLLLREKLRFPPVKLPLALFFGGTVLSLLLSGHVLAGWTQIRKFYIFFLVLLCLGTAFRRIDQAVRLILWLVAAATASALVGLVQFGERYSAAVQSGAGLYDELLSRRITGFMSLWMTFAGQLMVVLLLLGAFFLFSPGRRKWWPALAACAAVMALGLVLALTRGPWIGMAAGSAYLLWQWKRKSVLALPVLAVLAFLAAPATIRERAGSISQPRSELDSNQHRIMLWRTGVEMIGAHPWFGLGPEQVDKQFDRYIPSDIPRPLPWGWRRHLHNIYLQYAAERGIPVLLVFLWMVARVFRDFRRAAGNLPPGLNDAKVVLHGSIAAIVAVMVAGFFEHNLGDSEMLQMFLVLIPMGYVAAGAEVPQAAGESSHQQPIASPAPKGRPPQKS